MWGKIIIPMYRLWLNGLYGLYGPRCPLFSKRPINLISLSLSTPRLIPDHCIIHDFNLFPGATHTACTSECCLATQLPVHCDYTSGCLTSSWIASSSGWCSWRTAPTICSTHSYLWWVIPWPVSLLEKENSYQLIGTLEVWMKFLDKANFQANSSDWWLRHLSWNCPQINVSWPYWW